MRKPTKQVAATAKGLREAGRLWPQTCTNEMLHVELGMAERAGMAITTDMLRAEIRARKRSEGKPVGISKEEIAQTIRLVREAREYIGDIREGACPTVDAKDWCREADKILKVWTD